jgi:hypothetical protein
MKQVIVIALSVMFLASSVSGFAGDVEVVQGATHLRISCAGEINRLVEWDTMLRNSSGEERTVMVNCRFFDPMDQIIAEDVKHVKVKAYETRPVKGSKIIKTEDAHRILATKVEVQ